MRAIVQDAYGSPGVLELREIPMPAVGPDDVLVRVRAASVHPDVWHVLTGRPYVLRLMGAGLRRPRNPVPGTDVAGRVEAVGRSVTRFRPGDEVFGECVRGHQWHNGGAFAEYVAVRERALARKPARLTFEQAAAVPTSGLLALQGVRDQGGVQAGQRVLVNGAGGGVGSFAVQIAKASGAVVTGVDVTEKLDVVGALADRAVDATHEDFTRRRLVGHGRPRTGAPYDLIVDIPGNRPVSACRRALTPTGTYALIGHDGFGESAGRWFGSIGRFLGLLVRSPFVSQRIGPRSTSRTTDPLGALAELIEAGELTPAVDRAFPLGEVPAAIRYLAAGRARGKVVVTV
jgi:NADPH:quinone reductase-like Zn-dependent oxidoreductase